ncbi:hypothetical protein [Paraburkholderia sediminicola]|uniref:hypothetical protein n=1 Tax=Paraburkholderia sediminicola TaxID=458836 RepID=UPI0038BD0551
MSPVLAALAPPAPMALAHKASASGNLPPMVALWVAAELLRLAAPVALLAEAAPWVAAEPSP